MSIDDRLRTTLQWDPTSTPAAQSDILEVLASIDARVARRRRIRIAAVGLGAAAVVVVVGVAAPWAPSDLTRGEEPVNQPTHSTHWTPKQVPASPLDEHWEGSGATKAERFAALDDAGLERYGQAIYAERFAKTRTDVQFGNGTVTLATSKMGGRFLGTQQYKTSLHGTFTVRGNLVAMRFDEARGTTVFHWNRFDERNGERLDLTFIRTTASGLYGAPAEVFFRMFSNQPLWLWGCC